MIYQKWFVKERVEKSKHLDRPVVYYDICVTRDDGKSTILATTVYKGVAHKISAAHDLYDSLIMVIGYFKKQGTGRVFHLGYKNDLKNEEFINRTIAKYEGKNHE